MTKTSLLIILFTGYCLTLKAQVNAAYTADRTSGCSPLVVHFSNQTTGADGGATYHWDLGNGNTVVAENPQAVYTIPGSYTVTLTVTDGGQTSTTTGTVTVDQPPTVNFVANVTQGCAPTPMAFTSTSVAGSTPISTYLWDFGDGSTQTDPYGPGISHPYETAGVYGVSLTVTDADGCSSTKTVPNLMTILPTLTAAFTTPQTVLCTANSPVTFTNTSSGPGTLSYQWTFGDGGSSAQTSPTYAYTTKGTYTVTLTVTSSVGCVAVDAQQDLLNIANYQTAFTLPAPVCAGSSVSLTDNSIPAPTQRNWLVDGVNIGTVSPASYTFPTAGMHTVSLSNVYGTCPQILTKNITVNAVPVIPPFDEVLSTTCGGPEKVNFLDHTPGAVKWAWIFYNEVGDPYPQDTVFGGPGNSNVYATGTFDVGLTVTNAAGCSATTNQVLNVYPPVVDIVVTAGTPEACNQPMTETFASGQLSNLASWTWVFGDGTTSTAATPTHTFTAPGNYQTTLQWTDKNGCSGTSNVLYTTVSAPLVYDFTASSTTICAGQAVGFTGPTPFNSSEVYTSWFFGDGGESFSFNGATHTYTQPGVYSVTLNVENVGCSASVVKTDYITVLPSPWVNITAQTTCDSPRSNFIFNVTAGNGATGIAWQFGDGATVNTGPNITTLAHSYSQNGEYTITATASNGTCTAPSSVGIVVELKPLHFHLGVNATTICPAVFLSDTLQEVFPPGNSADNGAFMYVDWYYADGTPFVGPQNWVNIGALGNGSYTSELSQFQPGESGLYAVMGNLNGCKDTTNTVPLKIGGTTAAFTVVQDDRCYQLPVVLQDMSPASPGNPITSWLWNFGDGTTSTQSGTVSHTYAAPGEYTVTLTVTNAAGCASSSGGTASQIVTVNGPLASFYSTGGNVLPVGSTAVFANTSNVYDAAGVTYGWTFGDGTTSTDVSPAHVYGQPGTYTVTLTAQDGAGGCVSTATVQVLIQEFNNAFQMFDSYVSSGSCPPVTVQFTNTSYNYATLLWNFGDGQTAANVVNPSHVYAKPGIYYVSLTVVNGAGETLVTNDSVIVRQPSAVLAAPAAAAVCLGQADTLFATGGKGVKGYTWDFGDGVVGSGGATGGGSGGGSGGSGGSGGAADSTVTHVYTVAGLYTVRLVVTDTFGCATAAGGTVQVDVHGPPVAYVTPPVATMCLNGQVTLTANGGVTYSWQPATGLSAANVSSPVASPAVNTTYTVTVADDIGCTSTQSIGVTVVQPETLAVTPDSTAICPGKSVTLAASGAERYQWIGSTGGLSATDIADPVARPVDSSVVYMVTGGDTTGCFSDTIAVKVVLLPVPTVSAGPDETVQAGTPVTLAGEATGDVASWLWTPATYLSCTDCAQPVCTPKEPEQYVLTVTGGDGCTVSDTVVVSLLCDESKVRIPDAFTPNGDGHNDRWDILGISEVNHLVIFDRWGEKVFERDHFYPGDVDAGWDGMANGRPAPAGVYVYFAQMTCPTGGAFERRGTVVLVR